MISIISLIEGVGLDFQPFTSWPFGGPSSVIDSTISDECWPATGDTGQFNLYRSPPDLPRLKVNLYHQHQNHLLMIFRGTVGKLQNNVLMARRVMTKFSPGDWKQKKDYEKESNIRISLVVTGQIASGNKGYYEEQSTL